MEKVKTMIVDDHKVVRDGLKAVFEQATSIEVIAEAGTAEDAIALLESVKPDLILMDISLPGISGLKATLQIRQKFPDIKIIILTMLDQEAYVYEAIKAGATGYILKSSSTDDLIEAIITVNEGKAVIHPDATAKLLKEFVTLSESQSREYGLSTREMEILHLLAEGKSNKDIGKDLWISEQTVKTHVSHIFEKMGTKDRTETVAKALRTGLVD